MKKIMLSIVSLMMALSSMVQAATVIQNTDGTSTISGLVENYSPVESEATIKLQGIPRLFVVKNLLKFPEDQLLLITDSMNNESTVSLKVNAQNQVVGISK